MPIQSLMELGLKTEAETIDIAKTVGEINNVLQADPRDDRMLKNQPVELIEVNSLTKAPQGQSLFFL